MVDGKLIAVATKVGTTNSFDVVLWNRCEGWLVELDRGILEEAKERGFINGAIIVTPDDTRYILDSDPYMTDCRHLKAKAFNIKTARSSDVIIWSEDEGWLVRQEGIARKDHKSPLQEAMDRGYRKGAVVMLETEWMMTSDPCMKDGEVWCDIWQPGMEKPVKINILNKNGEYVIDLAKTLGPSEDTYKEWSKKTTSKERSDFYKRLKRECGTLW